MNKGGQLSFEVALIVVLIFLLTFTAAGQYFQVHDTTYAVAKLKAATIAELGTLDKQHAIKRIDYRVLDSGKGIRLEVYGDPKFSLEEAGQLAKTSLGTVCKSIQDATVFNKVSVAFDGAEGESGRTICPLPEVIGP